MGYLYYGNLPDPIEFPDRLLAHLKVVIATKLRRHESFTMSWRNAAGDEGGRSTVWIEPSIPLRFVFGSAEPEPLHAPTLSELANRASSTAGLTVDLDTVIPFDADASPASSTSAMA
ncbi:DUF7882 family protein [Microbacterium aquimaris]|uniref:DUF7882 domain-containing protein n=1 Tax=Microbacterium aquimaris TaxID=459816 RepID=A0ABU5N4Z6_9MICO|nr:hypothetical protein [Microbacterium aquimaris]MDZ8161149.1 hypothetical protein [Microbacterium aquimaris]